MSEELQKGQKEVHYAHQTAAADCLAMQRTTEADAKAAAAEVTATKSACALQLQVLLLK
jgi:hypothetical protein